MVGRIRVTPWLDHLVRYAPVARSGEDPEGVHQIRVAISRIRVWLSLGGWRVLHDDLRRLRTLAAPVRDLDVLLQRTLPDALRDHARSERLAAHSAFVAALDDERTRALIQALENLPGVNAKRARRGAAALAAKSLSAGRSARRSSARMHELRRALRRARFALEWVGEPTDDLHSVQEALGHFGDAWFAIRQAKRLPRSAHSVAHRRTLKQELRRARREAWQLWRNARSGLERFA